MLLLNNKPVDVLVYPNGESLLRPDLSEIDLETNDEVYEITLYYEGDADLFRMRMLVDFLSEESAFPSNFILNLPYVPFSRADRSQEGSVFTLKYFSYFINELGFDKVRIYEPHSIESERLIDRAEIYWASVELLAHVLPVVKFNVEHDWLILPDAGAYDRYIRDLPKECRQVLTAHKEREFKTGKILKIDFPWTPDVELGAKAVIVDDLCSRGGTFLTTAKLLREMGFSEVHLVVTHLESAGYNTPLVSFDGLDSVHATDSMIQPIDHGLSIPRAKRYNIYPLNQICPNYTEEEELVDATNQSATAD
jgi:ribose-phosphate pyrophosphokinase